MKGICRGVNSTSVKKLLWYCYNVCGLIQFDVCRNSGDNVMPLPLYNCLTLACGNRHCCVKSELLTSSSFANSIGHKKTTR